jgi:hypothetical protein
VTSRALSESFDGDCDARDNSSAGLHGLGSLAKRSVENPLPAAAAGLT